MYLSSVLSAVEYSYDASPSTMLIVYIITLAVCIGLAFIPASIAKKKGYSGVGFYFFGLAAFLPALIVACCLRNKNENNNYNENNYNNYN